MAEPPPPPTLRLEIDREALASNWRSLDALSGAARTGAAVKADCYGLGVEQCLPTLRDAGARDFFVAHWSEVAPVLRHVPSGQLAVLHGANNAEEAAYARTTGVRPVINSLRQAQLWSESGGGPCQLMVDTGINRLGIHPRETGEAAIQALDVELVMSHLAYADEDSPVNRKQLDAFRAVRGAFGAAEASLANSAGIALGKDYGFDVTRPGLSLYGGIQRAELRDHVRQVVRIRAMIIQATTIEAGERVGYNGEFTAPGAMRVGTVSIGYADGLLRSWGGKGNALTHEGRRLPILGKVSMDMIVLDLAEAPDLAAGDWVELPYDLPAAAAASGLGQYELLTVLGNRFGC